MARENQGLHAALIVFVVLTIMLAVSTFVFFSQYNDAKEKALKNEQDAQSATALARDKDTLMRKYVGRMMGFPEGDATEAIEDKFNDDMQKYSANAEESARTYHQVLLRQEERYRATNQSYEDALAQVKSRENELSALQRATAGEVAKFKAQAEAAENDKQKELLQFQKDRDRLEGIQKQLSDSLEQSKKSHQQALAQKQAELDDLNAKLVAARAALKDKTDIVNNMREEIPDVFLGRISWVNQRGGTVWINLGSADALRPQTKFSVFGAGANDVSETGKKASIEVTRVGEGHLSEARIVDDRLTDPILVGDRIYTPVWSVGEKRHVALAGVIDLDGDGRSDLQRMHALVEMNGGVIDAPMDDKNVRQGQLTTNTRYLVLGESPGANMPAELRADYVEMENLAKQLSVEVITLDRFLELMGWVRQIEVANFGAGQYKQFPINKDKATGVSSGKISEKFKPRRPPRTGGGTPY